MNLHNYWPLFSKAPRDQGLYNENIWPVFYQIFFLKSTLGNYYTWHWTLFPPHRNVMKIEITCYGIRNIKPPRGKHGEEGSSWWWYGWSRLIDQIWDIWLEIMQIFFLFTFFQWNAFGGCRIIFFGLCVLADIKFVYIPRRQEKVFIVGDNLWC